MFLRSESGDKDSPPLWRQPYYGHGNNISNHKTYCKTSESYKVGCKVYDPQWQLPQCMKTEGIIALHLKIVHKYKIGT